MSDLLDWQGRPIEPGATVYYPTSFVGRSTEMVVGRVLEVGFETERDYDYASGTWSERQTSRPRVKVMPRCGSRSGAKSGTRPAFPSVQNLTVIS
ncbi:hypothetical protein [Yinghuangia sp. YIM S09857]|uniref:hypothetical protein n=1 Tax=Yinghuangia sp. YIM S09857 TaxID=3436929 RepID=UPI003F536C5C